MGRGEEILLSHKTKPLWQQEINAKQNTQYATFDYKKIADPIRTVRWNNDCRQTG